MATDPDKLITITVGELESLSGPTPTRTRRDLADTIKARQQRIIDDERPWFMIPTPSVTPLGVPVNDALFIQEVWDTFIKPRQESGELQSTEERVLIACLRALYEGLMK